MKSKKHDIQKDLATFQTLRIIRGFKHKEVSDAAGLSPSTIRKLRLPVKDGGTRYPRNSTIDVILEAFGYQRIIVSKKGPRR